MAQHDISFAKYWYFVHIFSENFPCTFSFSEIAIFYIIAESHAYPRRHRVFKQYSFDTGCSIFCRSFETTNISTYKLRTSCFCKRSRPLPIIL